MDRLGGHFDAQDADDRPDYDPEDHDPMLDPPPSPVGQDERRMQVRAYNHWASLLGDRNFPAIEDLEPELLDDFGPYSVLLDLTVGLDDAEIRFLGDELATESRLDGLTRLADVPSRSVLSRITDHYMQILANQAPIGFEAEFDTERGSTVLYRGILLPYSSNNETIDFIYGVINWKEMADQATADELLLEIDQALAGDVAAEEAEAAQDVFELDEPLVLAAEDQSAPAMAASHEDTVYELGNAAMIDQPDAARLPRPAFGEDAETPATRQGRAVDALGNPLGQAVAGEPGWHGAGSEDGEDEDEFDTSIKTAADYGLPDWDEDEEGEDVDDLVDPLAGEEEEDGASSLMSLVSRGMRHKKSVDLSRLDAAAPPAAPAVPRAYEGEPVSLPAFDPAVYAAPMPVEEEPLELETVAEIAEIGFGGSYPDAAGATDPDAEGDFAGLASNDADNDADDDDVDAMAMLSGADASAPEGLYDALASARELAQAALTTEDRSRKTLYAAVSQAYDFSLEAASDPEGYHEIIADNGLTMQDRAPMTPIVKLVFGAEYDKTRLTEYAAVLTHAHRVGVERGALATWLRRAEGGLKGVVQAERRARREEQGKPVEDTQSVRAALAKKLRKLEPVALGDLAAGEGEFALVMVRRLETGELVVLGEVPQDIPLIERAARRLIG